MTINTNTGVAGVSITYYTDPLCCWSWCFEPEWQQLLADFKNDISYRYCMAGLLPDWLNFYDETLSVQRPAQMGPVWMQASQASGRYIYDRIWIEDPPASSYPACIAVKCAQLQSFEAGEMYLSLVRQAVMAEGVNVAKGHALVNISMQLLNAGTMAFDVNQFKDDLYNGKGLEAFKQDMQEVQVKRITRYPSLLITSIHEQPVLYSGCKTYSTLKGVVAKHLFKNKGASL